MEVDPTPEQIRERAAAIRARNMELTRDPPGESHKQHQFGFTPRIVKAVIVQPKWARMGGID